MWGGGIKLTKRNGGEHTWPNIFRPFRTSHTTIIHEHMLRRIPPSETKIKATHESDRLINHTHLLMLHETNQLLAPPRRRNIYISEMKSLVHVPSNMFQSGNVKATVEP